MNTPGLPDPSPNASGGIMGPAWTRPQETATPCPDWSREREHDAHQWDAPVDGLVKCPGWGKPETRPGAKQPGEATPTALPPFSGDDPVCPKCGNKGASTAYQALGSCAFGHNVGLDVAGYALNERLCRHCLRCSYAWDEAIVSECPPLTEWCSGAMTDIEAVEKARERATYKLWWAPPATTGQVRPEVVIHQVGDDVAQIACESMRDGGLRLTVTRTDGTSTVERWTLVQEPDDEDVTALCLHGEVEFQRDGDGPLRVLSAPPYAAFSPEVLDEGSPDLTVEGDQIAIAGKIAYRVTDWHHRCGGYGREFVVAELVEIQESADG